MNDTATLNDLIEVLNDGMTFYKEASEKVTRDDLKALFARMALHKAAIAADLQRKVAQQGESVADGGTFFGAILKAYSEMRTTLASDTGYAYIASLEEFEDRILHGFRDAVEKSEDPKVREIALRHIAQVTQDHNEMRDLKKAGQAS